MRSARIKFVGKDQPAPTHIVDGNTHIELPANQDEPFDHPDGRRILKVMPELYKPVTSKRGRASEIPADQPAAAQDEPATS